MLPKRLTAMLIAFFTLFAFSQAAAAYPAGTQPASETTLKPVQVFDVAAGKIIKTIPNDAAIQAQAITWLGSITGLAPQVSNDESCSFVYRVPLQKTVTVKSKDISVTSNDVFLFSCKDKPPMLLMFDEKRRPFLFLFKADIQPFIKLVGIPAS